MKDYFSEEPFGCRCGCGFNAFDPKMRVILNLGRERFGQPIIVNGGNRCASWNTRKGGAKHSAHLPGPDVLGHATDIHVLSDITRAILHKIFWDLGIRRFEVSDIHLHIDNATWLPTPLLASVTFKGVPET